MRVKPGTQQEQTSRTLDLRERKVLRQTFDPRRNQITREYE